MVNDIYQTPIPTKAHIPINSQYEIGNGSSTSTNVNTPTKENGGVPSLEELVNLCFENSIGIKIEDQQLQYVKRFEEFTRNFHCDESLRFLVDIFKYDFYYNRLFRENEEGERLNKTSSPNIELALQNDIPLQIPVSKPRKPSSVISARTEDHDPAAVLVSTIDDLDPDQTGYSGNRAWLSFRDQAIDSDSDYEDDTDNDEAENDANITSDSYQDLNIRNMLVDQWKFIIENYIASDAPEQINLSNKLYNEILEKNKTKEIHNPLILWKAKNEVILLIKENVYLRFVSQERSAFEGSSVRGSSASPLCVPPRNSSRSDTPLSGIPSPTLSPCVSANKGLSKNAKKSRFLHLSPPSQSLGANSPSHSLTSISNLLGHLKLNQTSPSSYPNSESPSPLYFDEKPTGTRFSKLWKARKNNNSPSSSPITDEFKEHNN